MQRLRSDIAIAALAAVGVMSLAAVAGIVFLICRGGQLHALLIAQ